MFSSDELFQQIQNYDLSEFKKPENFDQTTITDYLDQQLTQHNLQAKDIIIRFNMERSYVYQILNGRRKATRNFLIRFALLCSLSIDETQYMLSIGQRPILYPRNRFDAVIIYALHNHLSEEETNQILLELQEDTLF